MDTDLVFIVGCLFALMAFPALVGALADGSFPRGALLFLIVGGGLVGYAVWSKPGTYSFQAIPEIIARVFATAF